MAKRPLNNRVFEVGVIDWDRQIFDELIPLPNGTSYNSYLIFGGEKIALVDTVDPAKRDILFSNLEDAGVTKIDYVISNHAEQDHSGSIPFVLEKFPEAKVVTNEKCKGFLKDLLLIPDEKFLVVSDGEELSLGDVKLKFLLTPWVHWPETMVTYLVEDKILFSCDFFGSHRAASHLFVEDKYKVIEEAKRYYAEIMMPFRAQIRKNIEKISSLEIDMIAPSHGPVYPDPELIIEAYKDWISDRVKKKVLIPYVSMHGSTEAIVNFLVDKFIEAGIEVIPLNLPKTDIGVLAMELVDASTVIFAAPYVLAGAHPAVVYAAYLTNALRPKTKFISIVSSYGWGGKGIDQIKGLLPNLKAEIVDTLMIKGHPKDEDFKGLDELVKKILDKNNNL